MGWKNYVQELQYHWVRVLAPRHGIMTCKLLQSRGRQSSHRFHFIGDCKFQGVCTAVDIHIYTPLNITMNELNEHLNFTPDIDHPKRSKLINHNRHNQSFFGDLRGERFNASAEGNLPGLAPFDLWAHVPLAPDSELLADVTGNIAMKRRVYRVYRWKSTGKPRKLRWRSAEVSLPSQVSEAGGLTGFF